MKLFVASLAFMMAAVWPCSGHAAPESPPQARTVPGEIIVKFRDGANANARATSLSIAGQVLTRARPLEFGAELWRLDTAGLPKNLSALGLESYTLQALEQLKRKSDVEYAQANTIKVLYAAPANEPLYARQWHFNAINLAKAWDYTKGNVIVGVLDTGRLDHPDLAGKWLPGYDFGFNDANPYDDNQTYHHGMHVAGIIGANTAFNNPNNTTGGAGVCPDCLILPVRVIGANGGIATAASVAAMKWAADHGARVINMSYGSNAYDQNGNPTPDPCSNSPYEQQAVTYAVNKGTVVVAAAGNWSTDAANISPASCVGAIAVAASDPSNRLAAYSDFGSRVDLTAPGGGGPSGGTSGFHSAWFGSGIGCNPAPSSASWDPYSGTQGVVSSWVIQKYKADLTLDQGSDNSDYCYRYLSGTSMAAPHVAGLAALILSRNPTLTPAQVLQIMKSTARPVAGCAQCGAGLIDAGAALAATPLPSATFRITPNALTVPSNAASADFRIDWNAPGRNVLDWWGAVNGVQPTTRGVQTAGSGFTIQPLAVNTTYEYWIYPQDARSPLLSRASVSGMPMDFNIFPARVVVPASASQGRFVVSWRAPGYDAVDWVGSVNAGPRGAPLTTPGTGYTSQPIPVGSTYEYWVYPQGNQTVLLAHGVVTATR